MSGKAVKAQDGLDKVAAAEEMPDDSADWEALEKEVGDDGSDSEPEAKAAAQEEPESKDPGKTDEEKAGSAEPAKDSKPRLSYEELEKRHRDLQGAVGQERGTRKELQTRVQNMETVIRSMLDGRGKPGAEPKEGPATPQQEAKAPSIEEDPVGYFNHRLAAQEAENKALRDQITALHEGTIKRTETIENAIRQDHQRRQFWDVVTRSEAEMQRAVPDYNTTVAAFENATMRELEVRFPDDLPAAMDLAEEQGLRSPAELRQSLLNNYRVTAASQALRLGRNPAEYYYQMAVARGHQQPIQAPAQAPAKQRPTAAAQSPVKATKAGMQASKSLGGSSGGNADNDVSPEDLAQMYLDDPDQADKMFERMSRKGMLG